jgi:tRNA(fMet)-specific endonuclease VapC
MRAFPLTIFMKSWKPGEMVMGGVKMANLQIKRLETEFEIIPTDEKSAEIFGMLKAILEKSGSRLDDFNLIIASCAMAHNLTLVTNNVRHFKRINGLKLTNWSI